MDGGSTAPCCSPRFLLTAPEVVERERIWKEMNKEYLEQQVGSRWCLCVPVCACACVHVCMCAVPCAVMPSDCVAAVL